MNVRRLAMMSRQARPMKDKSVVHPPSSLLRRFNLAVTGIDPRHKLHRLSLLPSGPDEVHDRLLRGGRSTRLECVGKPSRGNSAPHKADFGCRAPLTPHLAQPGCDYKDAEIQFQGEKPKLACLDNA